MDPSAVLLDLYGRILPLARRCTDGLGLDQLLERPSPEANSIAWLLWHLSRVEDHHVAELLEVDQLWIVGDWAARFGLDADPSNTGYGHSPAEVATVRPDRGEALVEYLEAVDARTREMLLSVEPDDLDRIVDRRWDPPVTMGVRLNSIAADCLQHLGQAAYLRGLLGA